MLGYLPDPCKLQGFGRAVAQPDWNPIHLLWAQPRG
jgi:hypothetical protein